MTETPHIVWFKRDLRVADHPALSEAARHGPVIPLYVVEPDWWAGPDMSGRQWDFIAECLAELRDDLAALGQQLIVRTGNVVEVLEELTAAHGCAGLWSHEETGGAWTYQRDKRVAAWAKSRGVRWRELQQQGVFRRLDTRDGWARRWDALMAEPTAETPVLRPVEWLRSDPIPSAADLGLAPDPCPGRQIGGRKAANERLESFLTTRGAPYRTAMSSPITAAEACSRLSPHLAWGAISLREVAQATWARQRALKTAGGRTPWRGAMASFNGRLHWRSHFMQKLEDAPRMETENLHRGYDALARVADAERLNAWTTGQTGFPFVDACMRSLIATGWINFRMRAMLMAVASYHLWLPWRATGQHLARMFTDYEPGIHWPQVQMQSGTTGTNTVRIYNPVKQGIDQDPTGVFTRKWVPELAMIDDEFVHEPWKAPNAGAVLGQAYPHPIVDHLTAAKEAREKVWAVRKGGAFRAEASAIQSKHGSRKSGIPMRGREGRRGPKRGAAQGQTEMDL